MIFDRHAGMGNMSRRQERVDAGLDSAGACVGIGAALYSRGEYGKAADAYRRAVGLDPGLAAAHYGLGKALARQNEIHEAIRAFQKAVALQPDDVQSVAALGSELSRAGQPRDGEICLRRALEMAPDDPGIHAALGKALLDQGRLGEGGEFLRKALELYPGIHQAYCNLGYAFLRLGTVEEALALYRKAAALSPDTHLYHSNILLTSHYSERLTPEEIHALHREWRTARAAALERSIEPHGNDRSPGRRLRIGYLSPDLSDHPVASFFEPLLASHERSGFEVFCYADGRKRDWMTERLENAADVWRATVSKTDEELCRIIREDRIDILVDLAGHTANNRMMVFARKPAPVQATYLGYPNTTGLTVMDYRITDSLADPPGKTEHLHSEELVRLPRGFLCYQPHRDAPDIGEQPSAKTGFVTFGSFNNRSKITTGMTRVWAEILGMVPGSRLFITFRFLSDPLARELLCGMLEKSGMPMDRVDISGGFLPKRDHLDQYNRVDISLDTFPYNGTTTTCESLWMGVPVISLRGETHVSRVGFSILTVAGLGELSAGTQEEYVEKAIELACDHEKRERLRSGLRSLMSSSPLLDSRGFVSDFERQLRKMWARWCGTGACGHGPVPVGVEKQDDPCPMNPLSHGQDAQHGAPERPEADGPTGALIRRGEALFRAGDTGGALSVFEQAHAISPDDVHVLNDLGVVSWQAGNAGMAARCFSRALELDPGNEDARFNLQEMESAGERNE